MKIKLETLINASAALVEIGKMGLDPEMTLYLFRNKRAIKPEMDAFNEQNIKLLEKHGATINGDTYTLDGKDSEKRVKAYMDDFKKLLSAEIEVDITPIPFASFSGKLKEEMLTPLADWMISIPEPKKTEQAPDAAE